jgi:hypothetical protein
MNLEKFPFFLYYNYKKHWMNNEEDQRNHQASDSEELSNEEIMGSMDNEINVKRDRFPYCIVWTPIPLLTWFFPFIGHMGIANSEGLIYDFAGPYYVSVDDFAFGRPTRYLQLDPSKARKPWDQCVEKSRRIYCNKMYNFFCDNCHNYVQTCLNDMEYEGRKNWGVVELGARLFFQGTHVNSWRAIKTYLPFFIVLSLMIFLFVGLPAILAGSFAQ